MVNISHICKQVAYTFVVMKIDSLGSFPCIKFINIYRNETFQCPISSQPTPLNIKVKDYNRFSTSIELGQCQWNIWDLIRPQDQLTSIDRWLPLYPTGQGEIHIAIDFSG